MSLIVSTTAAVVAWGIQCHYIIFQLLELNVQSGNCNKKIFPSYLGTLGSNYKAMTIR